MNFTFDLIHDAQIELPSIFSFDQLPQEPKKMHNFQKKSPQKRKHKIINPYKWKSVQNTKYVNFLKSRFNLMKLSVAERKKIKINVLMSNYVKTRNPQQCRSHHQKMMIKYGSLQNIISFYPKDSNRPQNCIESNQVRSSPEREMKIILDDSKQVSTQPFWYQYLNLYSSHQSQEFLQDSYEF